ncbi:VOC family protein [Frateuria sp. GZRR35]|uniref:VOC family protein n=1 Tax=unclassified Frateuria TaxID=2648894 RepID=UPI003EDCA092
MNGLPFLGQHAVRLDHVAIAVKDIDQAIGFYQDVLGMHLVDRKRIAGKKTGMVSAEFSAGQFSIVLVQGTEAESQVCRFIDEYGPGVQHVAIEVDSVVAVADKLRERGMQFETNVIQGPGLTQIFARRDGTSGVMFEFIERTANDGFNEESVRSLFEQLEQSEAC